MDRERVRHQLLVEPAVDVVLDAQAALIDDHLALGLHLVGRALDVIRAEGASASTLSYLFEGIVIVESLAVALQLWEQHQWPAPAGPTYVTLSGETLDAAGVMTGVGAAVNIAQVQPGDTVAVLGSGGVGLSVVQGARLAGASRIVAVDIDAGKLETARRLGATDSIDSSAVDPVAAINDLVPGGVDYAFDAIGKIATTEQSIAMLGLGGAAVIVGLPPTGSTARFDPLSLAEANQRILGSNYGSVDPQRDIPGLVDLYMEGQLDLDSMVSSRRPLEAAPAALDDLAAPERRARSGSLLSAPATSSYWLSMREAIAWTAPMNAPSPPPTMPSRPFLSRLPILLLLLAFMAVSGLAAHRIAQQLGLADLQATGLHRLDLYTASLEREIGKYAFLPGTLGLERDVLALLGHPGDNALAPRVSAYLEQLNERAGTLAIYLVDTTGHVVASSNWRRADSFLGEDLAFRPYFRDAMANGSGRFFGIGTTRGEPGYYLASALADESRTLGVAVIKVSLEQLENSWTTVEAPAIVSDENGVVILGSVAERIVRLAGCPVLGSTISITPPSCARASRISSTERSITSSPATCVKAGQGETQAGLSATAGSLGT